MNAEERAIRAIIRLMIHREYAPGQRLQEAELAKELGMSRTPVRNALRKLSAEGLLDMQPNRGCFIPFLNNEDMKSVFLLRSRLESFAAEQAAINISKRDLETLKELIDNEYSIYISSDPEAYRDINEKIHTCVLKASGNTYLIRIARPVILRSQLYIFYYGQYCRERNHTADSFISSESHPSIVGHSRIVRALEESDGEVAGILTKRHILGTLDELTKARMVWGDSMFEK